MTSQPPFLDQIDHAKRQQERERALAARARRFTREEMKRMAEVYSRAVKRRPEDWQLRYNFGNLLAEMGEPRSAAAEFELALRTVPQFVPIRLALAHAWLGAGRSDLARAQLEAAVRLDKESNAAREALASLRR
jgi:Tfp pilus assembly protein PilF